MGSCWRHIESALTFRGRTVLWLDGHVRERELSEHPVDAALHHRVALVNASPSAVHTLHSAFTADPEKARAPRYAPVATTPGRRAAGEQNAETGVGERTKRETTADQLRRMRLRYFLKTAETRSTGPNPNAALTASAHNANAYSYLFN